MKRIALATLFALTAAVMSPAAAMAQAKAPASPLAIPVVGSGGGALFNGTFQLQKFATDQGQLVASGMLTGVVTTAAGVNTSVARTVTLPAAIGETTCQ